MKIVLIRHGLTAGNLEKRYVGATDEPLCAEGVSRLAELVYPRCELLVCSPMKRCVQTAGIIFPAQEIEVCGDLRECDFGDFEGKNYVELSGDPDYRKWIDSGGELPFPNGEAPADFRKRCADAFEAVIARNGLRKSAAFVVHGGTIMSILEKFAVPHRDYFSWRCENGRGYVCETVGAALRITEKI